MRRIRVVFALLAVALVVAAALLLHRALADVRAERAARRSALAARVFDEMERALSELLAREEVIPFGGWMSPPQADPPFVAGRFELLPGGAVHLSRNASPSLAAAVAAWAERRAAAGERRPLAEVTRAEKEAAPPAAAPASEAAKDSLYGVLQSLNRGAEPRAQRAQKQEALPAAEAQPATAAAPAPARPGATPVPVPPDATAAQEARAERRATVDPLLGDRLDAAHLVLARTIVVDGDRAYRQGLVLDAGGLGDWLRGQGLGGAPLEGARLSFSTATSDAKASAPDGAFAHRFAEPFEALSASLALPPLPDAGNAGTVLRLSLLVVVAGGAGLFALYRMVTVALRYAEQRSNFVAAVSHELKTPLTAIRMYGEMLRDGLVTDDAKRAQYYRTITAESERLSRLIDNVLEFARSERSPRALELREGALGAEVTAICEALRPHAAESGFSLVVEVGSAPPGVCFDRDALAQILVNLVDNALKYARGASRREIEITCAAAEGAALLRVRDFGPGVPSRELGRVFDLFHRGESELTRATRGTGLGLALVRSLAGRMGVRATAHNAGGGGFEVTLRFPLAQAASRVGMRDA